MNLIESVGAQIAQYETEAEQLNHRQVIDFMRNRDFHVSQTGEDAYAVLTVELTERGLGRLYALVKLDEAITNYQAGESA